MEKKLPLTIEQINFIYPFMLYSSEVHDSLNHLSKVFKVEEKMIRELNGIPIDVTSSEPLGSRTLVFRSDYITFSDKLRFPTLEEFKWLNLEQLAFIHPPFIFLTFYMTSIEPILGRLSFGAEGISFTPANPKYRNFFDEDSFLIRRIFI